LQQEDRQTAIQQEPFDTSITPEYSRDILYVKGVLHDLDTIHLFVNHWPSKYGGEKVSGPKRKWAATLLANICDSILDKNPKSNILAMGDFNDTPEAEVFGILERLTILEPNKAQKGESIIKGTIKYQGIWERIDHFFVSPNLLDNNEPVSITPAQFTIVVSSHLLERDRKFTGVKPRRTYIGPRYNGGLSDHLPIILKIQRNW
jgi:endonuclease/exonuclease/phosphatase family metal-dependent hydrolase